MYLCVLYLFALTVTAFGMPYFSDADPNAANFETTLQPPGAVAIFGTDALGRDMLLRVIAGARITLMIACLSAVINLFIGVTAGALAGYFGGLIDTAITRTIDILYGVPTILIVILLMVKFDTGITSIIVAIGLTYWLSMARIVRAEVQGLRRRDFVQSSIALGASTPRILLRHILPNIIPVVATTSALFIPEAIFIEAFLSYVGLGVQPPDASWGSLCAEGTREMRTAPHLLIFPAAALCLTTLAFNIIGQHLTERHRNPA